MAAGGITGFPIGGGQIDIGMTGTPSMVGFQHGSGATRSGGSQPPPAGRFTRSSSAARLRPRSRDRGRYPRPTMQFQAEERFRTQPAGPQEAEDWTVALEAVNDRLDALDRYSKLHGQSIAHIEDDRAMLLGKITSVIETMEKSTSDRADGIHARASMREAKTSDQNSWQRAKQPLASSLS